MRTWALMTAVLLVSLVLAGCVDDAPKQATTPEQTPGANPTTGRDLPVNYGADLTNQSDIDGAHLHDEWGLLSELVLLDGAVQTADCNSSPFQAAAQAMFGIVTQQAVQYGCARFTLPVGKIVPEGTAKLRVSVDASEAAAAGGIQLYYSNQMEQGFQEMSASEDASETWEIETEPVAWDLPHNEQTEWSWWVRPTGSPAILDGSVDVKIIAEKISDWEPILASAHIDHWALSGHDFVQPGVLRALDTNVTVSSPSSASQLTGGGFGPPDGVPLADIIPPGTTQVSLVLVWEPVPNCPPGYVCVPHAAMSASSGDRPTAGTTVESGETYTIQVYDVPDDMSTDSPYAENSIFSAVVAVPVCIDDQGVPPIIEFFERCPGQPVDETSANVRIEVEAWRNPVDIGAVKARVGL